jgi:FkbM family methyltransferase
VDPNLIFDIGAFEGQDSEYYLQKGFRVVAVEANPELIPKILSRNAAAAKSGRLVIVNRAVAETEGYADLHLFEYSQWASLHKAKQGYTKSIQVKTILPSSLFSSYGVPYYLKIDIEGADIFVVRAISTLGGDVPKYVSFEITPDCKEAISILSESAYSKFKLVEQSTVPDMRPPLPPQEGGYADFVFTHANTGLFGEELPGKWLNLSDAISVIEAIDWETPVKCGWKAWYDIHVAVE